MESANVIDLPQTQPTVNGMEVQEIPDRRCDEVTRQLVQLGECMARRLQDYAETLSRIGGNESYGARERALVAAWHEQLERMRHRHDSSTRIGYCDGLCGGLLSHDLVGGLCPQCRRDERIQRIEP